VNALNASFGQGNEVPADTLFLDTNPFYDAAAKKPAYDLAAAQKLIDAYVAEKGGPVRFKMGAFLVNRGAAEFIQAQFSSLKNVQMDVESGDTSALVQSVTVDRNFQAQIWGVNLVPDPESQLYEFLHSTSSGNFSGYKNAAMDAALDKGRTALSDAERKAAYQEVQKILMEDVPTIFLYHTQLLVTAKATLHDVTLWNEGAVLADRVWKG
jgi:peptide/nickel transport system substrate-binding protein